MSAKMLHILIVNRESVIRRFVSALEPMTAAIAVVSIGEITVVRHAQSAKT